MLLRHCCRFWQQCRSNVRLCCQKRQQCRTGFALNCRPLDKVKRCFDNVASTLLLVLTGLNNRIGPRPSRIQLRLWSAVVVFGSVAVISHTLTVPRASQYRRHSSLSGRSGVASSSAVVEPCVQSNDIGTGRARRRCMGWSVLARCESSRITALW